jgi:hypothetical protein
MRLVNRFIAYYFAAPGEWLELSTRAGQLSGTQQG